MSIFALFLFLFTSLVAYSAIEFALATKGCLAPAETYRVLKPLVISDLTIKIGLLPLFNEPDTYICIGLLMDVALIGYNIVYIYWNFKKQNHRILKKFPSNENYTLLGLKLFLWMTLDMVLGSWFIYKTWIWEDPTEMMMYVVICDALCFLWIISIAAAMIRLDRVKVPAMRSLHSLESNKAPIVLLRSFELDRYPAWNNRTFDEELCGSIDVNDCPVISLADPDQILPTGGSLKIQSKDDYWKSVIEELLRTCRAIVIVEGDSNGLGWEIERIKKIWNSHPDKIFFYIPANKYRSLAWCVNGEAGNGLTRNFSVFMMKTLFPHSMKKNLNACWDNFKFFLKMRGFSIPDKFPGQNTLIAYSSNGTPREIHSKDSKQLFEEIANITSKYKSGNQNYREFVRKIESYEVNGFMNDTVLKGFHQSLSKLVRTDYVTAGVLLFFATLSWFLVNPSFIGM